jgi:hypothetical protein
MIDYTWKVVNGGWYMVGKIWEVVYGRCIIEGG